MGTKLKVRPLLLHSKNEVMTIIKTLQEYRNSLSRLNRDKFDIVFSKIVRYGQNVVLDENEMKQIVNALKHVAFNFRKSNRKELINLAFNVHFTRVTYLQMINKNKKRLTA